MKKLFLVLIFLINVFTLPAFGVRYTFSTIPIYSPDKLFQVNVFDLLPKVDSKNCIDSDGLCIWITARYGPDASSPLARVYVTQNLFDSIVACTARPVREEISAQMGKFGSNLDPNDNNVYLPSDDGVEKINFASCSKDTHTLVDKTSGSSVGSFFDGGRNDSERPDKLYIKKIHTPVGGYDDILFIWSEIDGNYNWRPIKPEANLNMLKIVGTTTSNTSDSRFYLSTDKGIYKCDNSINEGKRCTARSDWIKIKTFPRDKADRAIAVRTVNSQDQIFVSTPYHDGLYVSLDGGITWPKELHYTNSTVPDPSNWAGNHIYDMALDDSSVYLAAFQGGIAGSKNNNMMDSGNIFQDCKKIDPNVLVKGGISIGTIGVDSITWKAYLYDGTNTKFFGNFVTSVHPYRNWIFATSELAACKGGGVTIGIPEE